eukprot:1127256_1
MAVCLASCWFEWLEVVKYLGTKIPDALRCIDATNPLIPSLHSNTLHHNVLAIHCIFACGLCCFQFVLHSNCKIDSVCDAFQLQCILNYKIDSVCVAFCIQFVLQCILSYKIDSDCAAHSVFSLY